MIGLFHFLFMAETLKVSPNNYKSIHVNVSRINFYIDFKSFR